MNHGLERISKEVILVQFKALSCHLPEETEEYYGKPQSGWPVPRMRFEPGTSQIQSKCSNHSAALIGFTVSGITDLD
jgi:hypothetical protein